METTNDMLPVEAAPKQFSGWLKAKISAYRGIAPTSSPVPVEVVASRPAVQEQTTAAVPNSPEPVPEYNSKRVLLIERDWLTRLLLANQMVKNGFDVEVAQSWTEALTKLRDHPKDGILMEPTQDAGPTEELIKRIREICNAPIYIFSAQLGDEDRRFIAPTVKVYSKLTCAASHVFSEMALDLRLHPNAARPAVKPLGINVMATLEKRAKQLYNDSTLMADKAAMTAAARKERWSLFRIQVQGLANAAAVVGARSLARQAAALDYFVEIFNNEVQAISSNDWESIISAAEILEMLTRDRFEAARAMADLTAVVVSAAADIRQQGRNALRIAGFHAAAFESGKDVLHQMDLNMTHLLVLHAAAPDAVKLVSAARDVLPPHKLGVILLKPPGIERLSRGEVRPRRGATVNFLGETFHPRELTLDALTLLHKLRLESASIPAPVSVVTQEHERVSISSAVATQLPRNGTPPVNVSAPRIGIPAEAMSVPRESINPVEGQTTDAPAVPAESEPPVEQPVAMTGVVATHGDSQFKPASHPRLQLVSHSTPMVPNGSAPALERKADSPATAATASKPESGPGTDTAVNLEMMQRISAGQAEISSLQTRLDRESQRRRNLEANVKELEGKLQMEQNGLAASRTEAKQRISAAQDEISSLRSQLVRESQERENLEAKLKELESKNEQGDLAAAQAETQKLRDALRESSKELEQSKTHYNAELQQLRAAAERKLSEQTQAATAGISSLQSQLLRESQERENVEAKLKELENKLKHEQSALAAAHAETQKLHDALRETGIEFQQATTRYSAELQQLRAAAERKPAEQKAPIPENFGTHHSDAAVLQKRNRELIVSLARTTLELEAERNARRDLQQNAATLKEQLGNLHNQISQQLEVERANEHCIRGMEEKLQDGAEMVAKLQRDLEVTSAMLQTAEQEKRAMKNCESEMRQTLSLFEQAKSSFELTRQDFIARAETDAQTIKTLQADLEKEMAERQRIGQLLIVAQTRLEETTRISTTEVASLQSALQAEQFERRQLHCKLSHMQSESSSIPRERVQLLVVRNALHSTVKMLRETSCQLLQQSLSHQQKQSAATILELTLDLQTTLESFHPEQPEPANQDLAMSAPGNPKVVGL